METGLSYFGARYYSSDLSIWLSVDPMSDKYPSLSPYVYCANNPVKCVDFNGEEVYEFDESGKYLGVSGEEGSPDQIAIVKSDGSRSLSEEYEHGTIIACNVFNKDNPYTDKIDDANMLDIKSEDAALELLSFVANNSNVEWEVASGEDDFNNCSVVLGTILSKGHANSRTYLRNTRGCTNVSLVAHNHPDNNGIEAYVSEADIKNAKGKPHTTFLLYTKILGFQNYDENGNPYGQYVDNEGKIKTTKRQ